MAAKETILVPDIGDFDVVDVVEVLVQPGDEVAVDDSLITLESDKASMEVPSTVAGVVAEVHTSLGDQVGEGAPIVTIEVIDAAPVSIQSDDVEQPAPASSGDASTPRPEAEDQAAPAAGSPRAAPSPAALSSSARPSPTETLDQPSSSVPPHASPSVRRFARELGADLAQISGTGPKGRILKEDVQGFVKVALQRSAAPASGLAMPAIKSVDFSRYGEVEEVALSRMRRASARNLHGSWITVPHVTQFDEADITDLEAFRQQEKEAAKQGGVRLTMLAFIMKAAVSALQKFPDVNSSLHADGDRLIRKHYYHLGIAVDTPNGLVVPVVRDVERKDVLELAAELGDLSARARDGKLQPTDIQGASFSISSLGGIGGTGFTPIVNAPEVAILGVARSQWRPVYRGADLERRLILPFSLSYDHRVIDGAAGVRFTTYLAQLLSDMRRLLL